MEPLNIKLGVGAPTRSFGSYDGVRAWLESEEDRWEWLWRMRAGHPFANQLARVSQGFAQLQQEVEAVRSRDFSVSVLSDAFQRHYDPVSGPLVDSESAAGSRVLHIRDTVSPEAASFAYLYALQNINLASFTTLDQLRAVLMLATPAIDEPQAISKTLTEERIKFRDGLRSERRAAKIAEEQRALAWETLRSDHRRVAAKALRRRVSLWRTERELEAADARAAVESIQAVELAYTEAMALKAPVDYWTKKADTHRTSERAALGRLCWFFPAAIIGLGIAFVLAARTILRADPTGHAAMPFALYIVISGALATISAIVFWIGRLLTKLYLSEHHLRHDAEERAVMTTTYLALTRERAAEETERHLILSALFRATPDGIVKDDGPADLGLPAAIIAKLVSK